MKKKGGNIIIKNHKAFQRKRRKYQSNDEEEIQPNVMTKYQNTLKVEVNNRITKLVEGESKHYSPLAEELNKE